MRFVVSMETFSRGTSLSDLDPWYVTGFVEGEGTFTYSRSGRQMALYFAIKLTELDEPILDDIRAFFGGIGKIYYVQPSDCARPKQGRTKAASYYRVSHREQLPAIVEHFDRYPMRGTKAAAYRIWREMVMLKQRFRNPPRDQLESLAVRLSASQARNRPFLSSLGVQPAKGAGEGVHFGHLMGSDQRDAEP
jgi:hypothetical protein